MRNICYIFLLLVMVSCSSVSQDTKIFNGEIWEIEDNVVAKEVEFQELTLKGPNFGYLAVYDSLAVFMNPKLSSHWYQVFNLHTLDELGRFTQKGKGHDEFTAVGPVCNFRIEKNDLKTLIFDPNRESVSVWNIRESLEDKSTSIECQIKMPWIKENSGACYSNCFLTDSNTIYAKVSSISINEHEATLPYYQERDRQSGGKTSEIQVFNKCIVNRRIKMLPEVFLYSHDAMKPDGSRIAQAMLYVPQLNIIDTESKTVVGYHLDGEMNLSDLETIEDLRSYFTRICADDEYIYTIYHGDVWNVDENHCTNKVYVFDWDGNLISKITTKHCIDEIAVDNINKVLYTTSPVNEKLYYIKTDELTRNVLPDLGS